MLFLVLIVNVLWCEPPQVAIPLPDVSEEAFEKHQEQYPEHFTYIDYHHKKNRIASQSLFSQLKKGQYHYLDGQVEKSFAIFQKMSERRWEMDWGEKEREAIHFAMLRLAQLSPNSNKTQHWLKKALDFAPDRKPDQQVFPPPLIQAYLKLKSMEKTEVLPLPRGAEHFEQILVNGQVVDHSSSFIRLTDRKVRLSFLSNRYAPQVFISRPKELAEKNLPRTPLAQGSCQKPQWHSSMSLADVSPVRVEPKCQGPLLQGQEIVAPNPPSLSETSKKNEHSFLKSKWLWIGVTTLVTAVTLQHVHQQNQNGRGQPQAPQDVPVFTNAR